MAVVNDPAIGSQRSFLKRQASTRIVLGWLGVALLDLVVPVSLDAAADLPTTQSTQPAMVGRDTPAGAMNVLVNALEAGDAATIADSYYLPEDVDGSARRANAQFDLKQMELYRAIAARFGKDVADKSVHWDGIPPRKYSSDDFYFLPQSPDMANPRGDYWLASMRHSDDGIWRIGGPYPVSKEQLESARDNGKLLARRDAIIAGIKAGAYATPQDLDYELSGRKYSEEYDKMLVREYEKQQAALKLVAVSSDAEADLPTTRLSKPVMIGRDTPAGAMNIFVHALEMGDAVTVADSYYLPEDTDSTVRAAKARLDVKKMELYEAVVARFGKDAAEKEVRWSGIPPRKYLPSDFYIDPTPPHMATLLGNELLPPMRRSDDGIWRFGGGSAMSERQLDGMRNNQQVIDRLDRVITGIEAGSFATVGELDYELSGRKAGDEYDEKLIKLSQQHEAALHATPDTVDGAIALYLEAGQENNVAGIAKFFYAEGDSDGKLAAAHAERVLLVNGFCQAMNHKLGDGEQMMRSFGLVSMSYTPGEIGKVIERRDSATGMLPGHDILKFRRVNGVWKVDVTPDPPSDTGQQLDGMTRDNRSIDQVTKDVVSGKYTKVGQVRDALVAAELAATPDANFKATNYKLQGE